MAHSVYRKLSALKPGVLYVGVDLGLDENVAKVVNERARVLTTIRFEHNHRGYAHLAERMEDCVRRHRATGIVVAMEPTNYFWMLLAAELERRHIDYYLVNAYTVCKHREGDQIDRSKDDQRDALVIADLVRTGKYTETRLLHGQYAGLRQYVVLQDRLRRDLARQKTLLRHGVGMLFPELTTVFKDLTSDTAVALLRHHAAAGRIRERSVEELLDAVRVDFTGRRLMVSKLREAHALAAQSVGLVDATEALQLRVRVHLNLLLQLQAELAGVEDALITTFRALPQARYLLSIHGLGEITAAVILAEIGDPKHYRNRSQLIKLAGTQPTPNTSGRKTRSSTPMSRQGRPRLRTTLYFACMRLVQYDPAFARLYHLLQERSHNPLTKGQALGVLMNKLLRIVWALMRHQTCYDAGFQAA
jgi:transposase